MEMIEKPGAVILGEPGNEVLAEQMGTFPAKHGDAGLIDYQCAPLFVQGEATDRYQVEKNGMVFARILELLLEFPEFVFASSQLELIEPQFMQQAPWVVLLAGNGFGQRIFAAKNAGFSEQAVCLSK